MGLYTLRVRMVPQYSNPRGSGFVEMTHHFAFENDEAATNALHDIVGAFNGWDAIGIGPAITLRWVVARGEQIHEATMYRRDITNPRTWVRLQQEYFELGDYASKPIGVEFGSVSVTFTFTEKPMFRHAAGAVLVRETTENPQVQRRVYVGPLSPVMLWQDTTLLSELGTLYKIIYPHPEETDGLWDPDEESIDIWRPKIAEIARDHCANLETRAGDGYSVVPSWKYGEVLPVLETRASTVRAIIHTRGERGPMTSRE